MRLITNPMYLGQCGMSQSSPPEGKSTAQTGTASIIIWSPNRLHRGNWKGHEETSRKPMDQKNEIDWKKYRPYENEFPSFEKIPSE